MNQSYQVEKKQGNYPKNSHNSIYMTDAYMHI